MGPREKGCPWPLSGAQCPVDRWSADSAPWALLWSELHRLDIAPREEANAPTVPAPPPVGVQGLQDLDDVTAAEAEL